MGAGVLFVLNNFTPYNWIIYDNPWKNGMNSWDPPSTVNSFSNTFFYGETDGFTDLAACGAEVKYQMSNQAKSRFSVKLVGTDGKLHAAIDYVSIQVDGGPTPGSKAIVWGDVGFTGKRDELAYTPGVEFGKRQAFPNVILGGQSDSHLFYGFNNSKQTDWMQHMLGSAGKLTLRQMCLPYSHDAGMSKMSQSTAGAFERNTLTQILDIGQQLQAGARWFDLRPTKCTTDNTWWTGHLGHSDAVGWQGGLGQSFDDIINQINAFTESHHELLIVEMQWGFHVGDVSFFDHTGIDYLAPSEWIELMWMLKNRVHCLFTSTTEDLTKLTMNDFIGQNRAAVLFTYKPNDQLNIPPELAGKGFFTFGEGQQINHKGSYTDSTDIGAIRTDQESKLQAARKAPTDPMFLMSYTCTLENGENVSEDILNNSYNINPIAFQYLLDKCTPQSYPNLIAFDRIGEDATLLAISVIFRFALPHDQVAPPTKEQQVDTFFGL